MEDSYSWISDISIANLKLQLFSNFGLTDSKLTETEFGSLSSSQASLRELRLLQFSREDPELLRPHF